MATWCLISPLFNRKGVKPDIVNIGIFNAITDKKAFHTRKGNSALIAQIFHRPQPPWGQKELLQLAKYLYIWQVKPLNKIDESYYFDPIF